MDGFYDQQVPFMVPGVSLCGFGLFCSPSSNMSLLLIGLVAQPPLTPLLPLSLHCLLAPFRNLDQRNVEGGLWLTERGSFWTQIWPMIPKVVKLSLWFVASSDGSLWELHADSFSLFSPAQEFSFWCLLFSIPELFQDLSQLQEAWLAEGKFLGCPIFHIKHSTVLFNKT